MKKILLGFAALIMIVSFSAFVSKDITKKSNTTEQELYWYPVNSSTNEIDHTALINTSSTKTKTEMRNDNLIPCPEGSGSDCIRGFSSVQASDHDSPGVESTQRVE